MVREIGIIEKILINYGFIQCMSRNVRLFFHFSALIDEQESINIGDFVEFQQSVDKRTCKPIANNIIKLNLLLFGDSIEEDVPFRQGIVHCLPDSTIKAFNGYAFHDNGCITHVDQVGQHSYLPFKVNSVELCGEEPLRVGDKVLFRIAASHDTKVVLQFATNVKRIGYSVEKCETYYKGNQDPLSSIVATLRNGDDSKLAGDCDGGGDDSEDCDGERMLLELCGDSARSGWSKKKTGIISNPTTSHGIIDISDNLANVRFDAEKLQGGNDNFKIGCNADFELNSTQGTGELLVTKSIRSLACDEQIAFEEIDSTIRIGRVTCLPHANSSGSHHNKKKSSGITKSGQSGGGGANNADGHIVYDSDDAKVSSTNFKTSDRIGIFTLFLNDIVTFNILTDRRNQHKKAVNVMLAVDQSFLQHREDRKEGIVALIDQTINRPRGVIFSRETISFFDFSADELIPNGLDDHTIASVINQGDFVTFNPAKSFNDTEYHHHTSARRIRIISTTDSIKNNNVAEYKQLFHGFIVGSNCAAISNYRTGIKRGKGLVVNQLANELLIETIDVTLEGSSVFSIRLNSSFNDYLVGCDVLYHKHLDNIIILKISNYAESKRIGFITRPGSLECINTSLEISCINFDGSLMVGDYVTFTLNCSQTIEASVICKTENPYRSNSPRLYGRIVRKVELLDGKCIRLGIIEKKCAHSHRSIRFFFTPSALSTNQQTGCEHGDYVTFERINHPVSNNSIAGQAILIEPETEPFRGVVVLMKSLYGFVEDLQTKAQYFFTQSNTDEFNKLRVGAVVLYHLEYQSRIKKHNAVNLRRLIPEPQVVQMRFIPKKARRDRRIKAFSTATTLDYHQSEQLDNNNNTASTDVVQDGRDSVMILREPRNPGTAGTGSFSYKRLPRLPGDITTLERGMQMSKND